MAITASLMAFTAAAQTPDLIGPYQRYEDARSRGDTKAAAGYARESLAATESEYGVASVEYADALELLGAAELEAGNSSRALSAYEEALQRRERELGELHPDLIDALEAIAAIHEASGDNARAIAAVERILSIEQAIYGEASAYVSTSRKRLRDLYEAAGNQEAADAISEAIAEADEVTRSFGPGGQGRYDSEDGYATVRVFYGTNRARSGNERPDRFYGKGRGDLELGHLDVSIPETHKYGELETESSMSLYSFFLGDEAKKRRYVILQTVTPLDREEFYLQLDEYIQGSDSKDVFLFIHGYNVPFVNAARRAAQLAYDLDFDGTPMLYSWPSQASTAGYTVDEAVVRPSGRKLAQMLSGVVNSTGADRIHLIAHSMGNRALIEALQAFVIEHGKDASRQAFGQVVFTAPDVDREYFIDVMETMGDVSERTTLYASENDLALRSSRLLHGAPRAGLAGDALVVMPGLDTIDMSGVEADILGHSYFAANEGAIYDLFRLFWRGDPPDNRCGMQLGKVSGQGFWTFDVENCKGNELLQAGVIWKRFGAAARERIERRIRALTGEDEETEKEEWSRILDKFDSLISSGR